MNTYNIDAIFLERESTEDFFISLLNDTESYLRREQFIAGMDQNVRWDENGEGMAFDIPDIDFSDGDSSEPAYASVGAQKIEICNEGFATVSRYYLGDMLQTYTGAPEINHGFSQTSLKIHWNDANNQRLDDAA